MQPAARYLWTWVVLTLTLLGAVAAVNLIVDPYGLFRIVDVPGFNRIKSQAGERAAVFKRAGVARIQPTTVILGNSRAEIGFDPDSPAWPEHARPVFNLALPGAGVAAVAGEFAGALRGTSPGSSSSDWTFWTFALSPRPTRASR